jgi:hypothetical protein
MPLMPPRVPCPALYSGPLECHFSNSTHDYVVHHMSCLLLLGSTALMPLMPLRVPCIALYPGPLDCYVSLPPSTLEGPHKAIVFNPEIFGVQVGGLILADHVLPVRIRVLPDQLIRSYEERSASCMKHIPIHVTLPAIPARMSAVHQCAADGRHVRQGGVCGGHARL